MVFRNLITVACVLRYRAQHSMKYLFLFLTFVASGLAGQVRVTFDPGATTVHFTVGDVLHTVNGTFQLTRGEMWFEPSSGGAGGQIVVNAESGNSGSHARDGRMEKNVLQAKLYPEIVFAPDHIEGQINRSGDSQFRVHGQFTIHDATHELIMNVKAHVNGDQFSNTASFEVPYVKWGMTNPSTFLLKVSETVQIRVEGRGRIHFEHEGGTR